MPTLEPLEDSGEELWDWTNRGPIFARGLNGQQIRAYRTGGYRGKEVDVAL